MSNFQVELYHHGILGQKWGKKNGPPYPLDYNKLSAEEISKDKERARNEGDVETASKNRKYYTDQELRDVINRYNLNKQIIELSTANIKTGMQKVNDIANALGTVANCANKVADVANAFGKVSKALGGDSNKKEEKSVTSFRNTKEMKKILKNPGDYDDDTLSKISKRGENLSKLTGQYTNIKKFENEMDIEDTYRKTAHYKLSKKMDKDLRRLAKENSSINYKKYKY